MEKSLQANLKMRCLVKLNVDKEALGFFLKNLNYDRVRSKLPENISPFVRVPRCEYNLKSNAPPDEFFN